MAGRWFLIGLHNRISHWLFSALGPVSTIFDLLAEGKLSLWAKPQAPGW